MPVKKFIPSVWTGYTYPKSGKKIPRLMTAKEAEKWMKETGKPVYMKLKKYELDLIE